MHIGVQIEAPEGWQQMAKGIKYHFLRSDATQGRVLLAHFESGGINKSPQVHLLVMYRNLFEEGAGEEKIVPCENQQLLPPWLEPWSDIDLSQLDQFRPKAKVLHSERVEERYLIIAPTIQDIEQVLSMDNPESELNRRARLCNPPQNESRFRLWVLTYLCFGRDIWTLMPPFHRIGIWSRENFPNKKFGAPSIAYGKSYGHGCSKGMAEQCVKGYRKRAKLGKKMTAIYEESMIEDFKCRIVTMPSGMKLYISINGDPFPTYWQFVYQVKKAIRTVEIQMTLYGKVRHRAKLAASKGAFSEEVTNLMERIEADGYYTNELPRGYVDGTSLPPLCVVVGRDVLSGLKLGIGFSFGKERSAAYRMMLFCMAVPKDFFCMLLGITYVEGEWPSVGLPGHLGIDRGPGARKDLIEELEKKFPIKDIAPSWSGQSKATVESSHPKDLHIDGQPTFIQSDLTPIQLMRREVTDLIRFNTVADMEARFEPDSELAFVTPSPLGLWNYYDKLFRNDAIPINIAEAVRTFLSPVEFSLRSDGVWLDQRRFDSEELRETGLLDKVSRTGSEGAKIQGYMMDMCLRHIWIEYEGRLIFLTAKLRIRGDEETTYLSLEELIQWNEARQKVNSAYSVHRHAASSEFMGRFKDDTGKAWDSTTRRAGKPKRDALSQQEEAEAQQATSKRKAA